MALILKGFLVLLVLINLEICSSSNGKESDVIQTIYDLVTKIRLTSYVKASVKYGPINLECSKSITLHELPELFNVWLSPYYMSVNVNKQDHATYVMQIKSKYFIFMAVKGTHVLRNGTRRPFVMDMDQPSNFLGGTSAHFDLTFIENDSGDLTLTSVAPRALFMGRPSETMVDGAKKSYANRQQYEPAGCWIGDSDEVEKIKEAAEEALANELAKRTSKVMSSEVPERN